MHTLLYKYIYGLSHVGDGLENVCREREQYELYRFVKDKSSADIIEPARLSSYVIAKMSFIGSNMESWIIDIQSIIKYVAIGVST